MNQRLVVTSALASLLALGLAGRAAAADDGKNNEPCYGIAKAGQNDCASISGSHSCAGQATKDGAAEDWKYVAKGTCKDMKGMTAAQAKEKMKGKKS